MASSELKLSLFDGTRTLFPPGTSVLVTINDGNFKQLVRQCFNASQIEFKLPFYDGLGDNYTVLACVDGYKQAGYGPMPLSPSKPVKLDVMLVPEDAVFNFAGLTWEVAKQTIPFLSPPTGQSDGDAEARFIRLMEDTPKALACILNLVAAMRQIDLDGRTPVDFIHAVRWDLKAPSQDRFFAYCDAALIDAVRLAAKKGLFDPEYGCSITHPGASLSWKQDTFQDANVQLTFHTGPLDCVGASNWVTVEADIDYYRDPGAHALLELCRNALTGSLTEPAEVYVLRWIEHRLLGLPEFDPSYVLRPA